MEEHRSREAWLPLVAGLAWLAAGTSGGMLALLLSLVPGVLLVATGAGELLWSDDHRLLQFGALGGALGVVLALPGLLILGFWAALGVGLLSAASCVAVGTLSLRSVPDTERVPTPRSGVAMAAKVALDEAVLSTMSVTRSLPRGERAVRVRAEVDDALEIFASRGWLEKPESYHQTPIPLDAPRIRQAESRAIAYEHLSFDSEYEPHAEEPGRERWLGYTKNQTAHAWVLRHPGPARPWLVCIHGYRMGSPLMDISAFDPRIYHQKLGLNLLLPVLPLHGERRYGRRSGDGFMGAHPLDTVHAEAQAIWDIRRLLSWVRAQDAPAIGVFGLSLGGYSAALLACVEQDLACSIPGIPATSFERLLFRHAHDAMVREFLRAGLTEQILSRVFRPISPLVLEPKVAPEGRAIFGGVADRLVPPDQVRDLHEHWDEPPIEWYQGSHLSFARERGVKNLIETTLRQNGIVWSASSS
ncbi:MAG: alpha/beta hydrolase [Myxococcota bacterium]